MERTDGNRRLDGTVLVLICDFNENPDAATTQLLYGPGGSEIGTAGFDRPGKGDNTASRTAPLLPGGSGTPASTATAES